jgi:hypothetical protein
VSVAAVGVAVILTVLGVRAQDNQFQLFVTATDASGMPVTDLKAEDLAIAEGGMPCKIVTFERFNLPIKLTIIVDNGPDSDRLLEHYRSGLTSLVDVLPPDMEVTVFTTPGQPRQLVRPTTDKGELKKAFARLGRDTDEPRFTDALVEYSQRLEKDVKEKKLIYQPGLMLLATIASDPTTYQRGDQEKAMATIAQRGARVNTVVSTSRLNDNQAIQDLTFGRQGVMGSLLAKATGGAFEARREPKDLATLLPEWGKQFAARHAKQTAQYRVVLQRPASATGPLNPQTLSPSIRAGLKPAFSSDGRF